MANKPKASDMYRFNNDDMTQGPIKHSINDKIDDAEQVDIYEFENREYELLSQVDQFNAKYPVMEQEDETDPEYDRQIDTPPFIASQAYLELQKIKESKKLTFEREHGWLSDLNFDKPIAVDEIVKKFETATYVMNQQDHEYCDILEKMDVLKQENSRLAEMNRDLLSENCLYKATFRNIYESCKVALDSVPPAFHERSAPANNTPKKRIKIQ